MKRFVFLLIVLILALSACGGGGVDSVFPIPSGPENFTGDDNSANFQVDSSIDEMVEFYRTELGDWGLTERTLLTSITAESVSMVFDGHESGKAVVVQMVDLGDGNINVNIRFEDV